MKRLLPLVSFVYFTLVAGFGLAQEAEPPLGNAIRPAADARLADFLWVSRPIVVFADSPEDPQYIQQMELISERLGALVDRDVVVLTDTDPAARNPIRQDLRARGFMLVVIAKDGAILQRKPAPWDVREITRSIDKQPLRQREMRDSRQGLQP